MSKSIYFASDFHLGLDLKASSRERERLIVSWMDSIKDDAETLYIVGDLFDYWFEYREVVPRGFVRILAKIAEFTDGGIPVHLFTGNHDMWMFGYLEEEIGVQIHRQPIPLSLHGKKILLGHGDGLGPGDHGYKWLKKILSCKLNQWLFARIHPNTGIRLMKFFSGKSREKESPPFKGSQDEWLVQYCERKIREEPYDYLIFGHRHLPIDHTLSNGVSRYINLGDWMNHFSYAVLKKGEIELKHWEK